jgi:hypothetical protein
MTFIAEFLPLFVRGQAFQLVLAQFFEKRQTEPICTFSLCGKHCFPYLQDHGPGPVISDVSNCPLINCSITQFISV